MCSPANIPHPGRAPPNPPRNMGTWLQKMQEHGNIAPKIRNAGTRNTVKIRKFLAKFWYIDDFLAKFRYIDKILAF